MSKLRRDSTGFPALAEDSQINPSDPRDLVVGLATLGV